jgi:hypothetical protein
MSQQRAAACVVKRAPGGVSIDPENPSARVPWLLRA